MATDVVDDRIEGGEVQHVEGELEPGIACPRKLGVGVLGGEGPFFAVLRGPGHAWLQSLPFSRLASRVFAAAPQGAGVGARGQDGLSGLLGGDRE
jgi:uncharacterized protein (AIM24 family)